MIIIIAAGDSHWPNDVYLKLSLASGAAASPSRWLRAPRVGALRSRAAAAAAEGAQLGAGADNRPSRGKLALGGSPEIIGDI